MNGLRIGTSGWHYASWHGPFYPQGLKKGNALRYYASCFDTTEINNSFYRLPSESAVAGWRDCTPENFVFAWKASRFITHFKRLLDVGDSLDLVFGRMADLREKLGPVLFQLPPQMEADPERLARFLVLLPSDRRCTVEFRHPSWYSPGIFDLLSTHDVALCISDHAAAPAPWEVTASWVYVRGHGPSGRYHGSYSDAALANWAERIAGWRCEGRPVWCYFDNDLKSAAPLDAGRLRALVSGGAEVGTATAALSLKGRSE